MNGTTLTAGKLRAYANAKAALDAYGNPTALEKFINELKADSNAANDITTYKSTKGIDAGTDLTYVQYIEAVTYNHITDVAYATGADGHDYYTLVVAMKQAQEAYEAAATILESTLNEIKTTTEELGTAGTNSTTTNAGSYDDGTTATGHLHNYDEVTSDGDSSTYNGQKSIIDARLATITSQLAAANAALTAAQTAYDTAVSKLVTTTGDSELKTAQDAYKTAYTAYETALYNYNNAASLADYESELVIYINLKNDVTLGGINGKWQILPNPIVDNTAVFYYTSILDGGAVSEQLVDSIVLSDKATQDTYKAFDFDLNVYLDSAQVTYDDDGSVLATAANDTFDWTDATPKTHDVTAGLTDKTTIATPITWSESTTP